MSRRSCQNKKRSLRCKWHSAPVRHDRMFKVIERIRVQHVEGAISVMKRLMNNAILYGVQAGAIAPGFVSGGEASTVANPYTSQWAISTPEQIFADVKAMNDKLQADMVATLKATPDRNSVIWPTFPYIP